MADVEPTDRHFIMAMNAVDPTRPSAIGRTERVARVLAELEAATEARVLRQIEALLFGGFFTDGKVSDAAIALAKRVAEARKADLLPAAAEEPKETMTEPGHPAYEDRHERAADELVGDLLVDVDADVANGIHRRLAAGLAALEQTCAVPATTQDRSERVQAIKAELLADPTLMAAVGISIYVHGLKTSEPTETGKARNVAALKLAQRACCTYMGDTCDCKYGASGRGEQTGCPELRDMIEAAEAGKAQAEWIAVSERLPEEGLMVLFWHQEWPTDCNLIGLGRFRRDDDDGNWWEDVSEQDMTGNAWIYYSGVSHWRPLPPPPSAPEGT